jgi:hypothetical protein
MLYAGLDLSRKRLDFNLLDGEGATVEVGAAPPDVDGLRGLTQRLERHGAPIRAAIESMNGARFVHDRSARSLRVRTSDPQSDQFGVVARRTAGRNVGPWRPANAVARLILATTR